MERVAFQQLYQEFLRVLLKTGFVAERAELCARIFAQNMRDGVYSHGLIRFPQFVEKAREGHHFDIHATPEKVAAFGTLEQWDGRLDPGMVNATACMERAIALAAEHCLGCVALKNNNHWMRAGTYALQAAEAGCIGICWTNTTRLMPPWGSAEKRLGNNPLALAVPREEGHVLLDMAMSQFSGGKTTIYSRNKELFPVPGGYDDEGELSRDPDAVQKTERPLPIGYWKGSGLALLLDLLATLLSGGSSTARLARQEDEYGVSQVFVAIDIKTVAGEAGLQTTVEEIVANLHEAAPLEEEQQVTYPGERMLQTRRENLEKGIPVDGEYWRQVLDM